MHGACGRRPLSIGVYITPTQVSSLSHTINLTLLLLGNTLSSPETPFGLHQNADRDRSCSRSPPCPTAHSAILPPPVKKRSPRQRVCVSHEVQTDLPVASLHCAPATIRQSWKYRSEVEQRLSHMAWLLAEEHVSWTRMCRHYISVSQQV